MFAIELPPLRQRKDDLSLLMQSFLAEFNERNKKAVSAIDPAAMRILEQYNWPGNVREVRNIIERAVILANGDFIEPKHLPPLVTDSPDVVKPTVALEPGTTVEEAERRLILMTLEHTRDNKTRAAEILGISLKTLHNKLNRLRGRIAREETGRGSRPCDRAMRIGIKAKQIAAVTAIVCLAVVALSAVHVTRLARGRAA